MTFSNITDSNEIKINFQIDISKLFSQKYASPPVPLFILVVLDKNVLYFNFRFELMYGVTEIESINLLDPLTFSQGLLLKERDKELRTYFRTRCEIKPELCLQRTLDEYGQSDISQNNIEKKDGVYDYSGYEPDQASLARNALLDILSDARSVAPIVQMARYHAAVNMQSYFYVFKHRTHSREYIVSFFSRILCFGCYLRQFRIFHFKHVGTLLLEILKILSSLNWIWMSIKILLSFYMFSRFVICLLILKIYWFWFTNVNNIGIQVFEC